MRTLTFIENKDKKQYVLYSMPKPGTFEKQISFNVSPSEYEFYETGNINEIRKSIKKVLDAHFKENNEYIGK